jgi:hypothetical protein
MRVDSVFLLKFGPDGSDSGVMRPSSGFTYTVVQWTQHYRQINGAWYRDAIARRSDGALRLVSMLDESAVAA